MKTGESKFFISLILATLLSSCCQTFWVSQGRLSSKKTPVHATVYLMDSSCHWRSGYLLRIERDSTVLAEDFLKFQGAGNDYKNQFERVTLKAITNNSLDYLFIDEKNTTIKRRLSW